MKSILRATAILGSSSLVSILAGVLSAKAWAVLVGPSGLGFMRLLQSLVGLGGLIAGMGIGVGLVRAGAQALATKDETRIAALRKAAWLLFWVLSALALLLLTLFRTPISRWVLGGPEHADSAVLMGVALIFSLASGLQTSTLNAYHRVVALARVAILHSVIASATGVMLVWIWREQGIAAAVIVGSATSWVVSYFFLRRAVGRAPLRPTRQQVFEAARWLLRFGAPYTASMVVGTGVHMALPILVLHLLGKEHVGFYQAAEAVSITYLGVLLAAMAQDYYPRVSGASQQSGTLAHLVNQQHRLVMLVGVPMILGMLALVPYVVPIIYTAEFTPAIGLLEWQLVAALFKLSSWTMSYVILARSGSLTYFSAELIGGIATLAASWMGMQWFGLAGLGMGFLASYMVYYLVVWLVVRRQYQLVWTAQNKRLMLAAVTAALAVQALPFVGLEGFKTPVALLVALVAGVGSLVAISGHVTGRENAGAE